MGGAHAMRKIIQFVNARLQQMPYGLRLISNLSLLFTFIVPAIVVITLLAHGQYSRFEINGRQVTYEQFWQGGGFLAAFLFGIYCALLAYGLLRASRWSRPLCLLPPVVFSILILFHRQPSPAVALYNCLGLACEAALLVWYLFYRRTVRDYYASAREPMG
ncbi:MAG TPA: hypothetical protein VGJ73_09515 [Verrucomicrobiae bacterium]|jgi:hypothetical protein